MTLSVRHQPGTHSEWSAQAWLRDSRRDAGNGDLNETYAEYLEACESACPPGAVPATATLNSTHTRQTSGGLALGLSKRRDTHRLAFGASLEASRVRYEQWQQEGRFTDAREAVALPGSEAAREVRLEGGSRAFGLYATDTWNLAPATYLSGALRWNHTRVHNALTHENGPQPREAFVYHSLNPALGIAHPLDDTLTLTANLSQSNRVPTAIELGCADAAQPCRLPTGLQADPYLKQVISRTLELGARWQPSRGGRVELSVYRSDNRDDILFLRAPNTQMGYFANFGKTRHQGIDLSYTQDLGPVAARLAYSYLRATYEDEGALTVGERTIQARPGMAIAGLPRHTLRIGADWRASDAWLFGADAQLVSRRGAQGNEDGQIDGAGTHADWSLPGYAILNLRAAWKIARGIDVYTRINNVFDRRYESWGALAHNAFPNGQLAAPGDEFGTARFVAPGAPRSATVGLRVRY